ncbi:MAG: class II aldolase/adducin family protein [Burkholderiaceae bacterium]|nr:class II aldolase/adducin family protein [Burkholderiaceae bacterium]
MPTYARTIVDLCLALCDKGYFSATGGNVALRIDDEHIAVTPSATDYLEMTLDNVCLLRLADLLQVGGDRPPSVESSLHARVLRARPDAACSIHTHQPIASACALIGKALEVPPEFQATLGRQVPVVGYAPSGTSWLASRLERAVRPDIHAYLMRNHGVLCCGTDVAGAMRAVEDLERLAGTLLGERIARRLKDDPAQRTALVRTQRLLDHELAKTIEEVMQP